MDLTYKSLLFDKESCGSFSVEQHILEEKVSGERSQRKKKSVVLPGLLPETSRRTKKPLTPEEIEERNKKVAINAPILFLLSLQSKMN